MENIKTILFVDDSELILKALKRGLLDDPYHCLFATSGKEALEILEQKKVHIICSDIRMPDMDGLELLKIVKKQYPDIVRLVLSGNTHVELLLTAINTGEVFRYITKPWDLEEEFRSVLRQAVVFYEKNTVKQKLSRAQK